jgi:hypothetical protein
VIDTIPSVHGVPIRLSTERWMHIVEHHDDLAGHYHETVSAPDAVYAGDSGELLALSARASGRYLIVAYRESSSADGFVITALFTTRIRQIERRRLVWQKVLP